MMDQKTRVERDRLEEAYFLMCYYFGFSLMEVLSLTDEQRTAYMMKARERIKL